MVLIFVQIMKKKSFHLMWLYRTGSSYYIDFIPFHKKKSSSSEKVAPVESLLRGEV